MSNLSVGQIILDAQRVASRVKDLDTLGSALLVEAEGNNRLVESLRQFQDDLESLNRISSNKSNAEIINRIQQQNAQSSEILKENRELKICLEDYEYAMELLMQKYRQHMTNKVMESKINFREAYNDKLWNIIRQQREKINEMAAVMQRCAAIDDDEMNKELETMSHLRLENKTLRELLQISKQGSFGVTAIRPNEHLLVDQGIQTEIKEICDELTVSNAWVENSHNNNNNDDTVIENTVNLLKTDIDNANHIDIDANDVDKNKQINITANVAVVNITKNVPISTENTCHENNNVLAANSINKIVIKKEDIVAQDAIVEPTINHDDTLSINSVSNAAAANSLNVNNISNNTSTTNANDQLLSTSTSSSSSLIKSET